MMIAVVRPTRPATFLPVLRRGDGRRVAMGLPDEGGVGSNHAGSVHSGLNDAAHDGMVVDGPGPDPVLRFG